MRQRGPIPVPFLVLLLGCSASHRTGEEAPLTPRAEGPACTGGLDLGVRQLHHGPRFGLTGTGHVWFLGPDDELALASPDFGDVEVLSEHGWREPVISPDGEQLAWSREDHVVVRDLVTGGEEVLQATAPHTHGFVPGEPPDRARAWSCGDGTLTVLTARGPFVVADDVANCSAVQAAPAGPILSWRDGAERYHWIVGDDLDPLTFEPFLRGTDLRPGAIVHSNDGRFLLHQPGLACTDGGTTCSYRPIGYVQVHDGTDGSGLFDLNLGHEARMRVSGGGGMLVVHDGATVHLVRPGHGMRTFDGYRVEGVLAEHRVLAESDEGALSMLTVEGATELVPAPFGVGARWAASPDGSRLAIAWDRDRCLEPDGDHCRARAWTLSSGSVVGGLDVAVDGVGPATIRGISDAGHALVTDFRLMSEAAAGRGEGVYRVMGPDGSTAVSDDGHVRAAVVDGADLYWTTLRAGLDRVDAAGGRFHLDVEASDIVIDRPRSRVLRLRAFPQEEDPPSDLGPPTQFCVFATPVPAPTG